MESRYWIAIGLFSVAAVAIALAMVNSVWIGLAAIAPAFAAVLCLAPRSWLSSARYRRAINALAYASLVPAAIALAAAVGFGMMAIIAIPGVATFVLVMRQSRVSQDQHLPNSPPSS
jgi:hypothetical protein